MNETYLAHYGVKGQKWGVRRYRNEDGTLTPAGQKQVYKTLKKYSKSKDPRARLGQAVGEDHAITEAASKLKSAAKKHSEAYQRQAAIASKMEQEHFNERDRLDKKNGLGNSQKNADEAWETVRKKYGKEYESLRQQSVTAYAEYQEARKQVVDAYLGKYGNKRIGDVTASDALTTQIDWGISTGRLTKEIELWV